jgi:cold shock CspA family protein
LGSSAVRIGEDVFVHGWAIQAADSAACKKAKLSQFDAAKGPKGFQAGNGRSK